MREFDVVVLGAGAAGEVTAGGSARTGCRSRSSSRRSSAATARSTRACRRRRCCGPSSSRTRCGASPGLDRLADRQRRRAAAPRRGDPRPRRQRAAAVARAARRHARARPRPHRRRAAGRRRGAGAAARAHARSSSRPGSTPLIPDIPGLRESRPWTNREATTAKAVPARLAILGGGVVGVEMAQAWGALGSQVTLIHRGERLIEREEPFAGEQVLASLRELGVDVRLGDLGDARRARRRVRRSSSTTARRVEADELLVAVGRTPGTSGIGLEALGLADGRAARGRRRPARARATTGCTRSATSTGARC